MFNMLKKKKKNHKTSRMVKWPVTLFVGKKKNVKVKIVAAVEFCIQPSYVHHTVRAIEGILHLQKKNSSLGLI